MATVFELTLLGEEEARLRATGEAALDEIERVEEQISLFLPTSEISRINDRKDSRALRVDRQLFALLEETATISRRTDGAFDITVGSLMRAHGFRGRPRLTPQAALASTGMSRVRLEDHTISFDDPRTSLDLGAIGKGYAIDRAVGLLRRHGVERAFLHGGWSTLYALGTPPGAAGWVIGLIDPGAPERRIGSVALRNRALSVSTPRGRIEGSGRQARGHVVDPRSGDGPRRGVAWAGAASAATADALSTAFLLQTADAIETLCRRDGLGVLLLEPRVVCHGLEAELFQQHRPPPDLSRRRFLSATTAAAAAFSVGLPRRAPALQTGGDEIRVAMVGLGDQGKLLLAHLARMQGVRLSAICDVQQRALEDALAITGRNVETYLDHRHLLDVESLDAVVVATPTHLHAPVALASLSAGHSVFCEAPLARSLDDCRAMYRAADESGAIFQVGHQRRWSRLYPHALSHFRTGSIGRMVRLGAQWNRRSSWRRPVDDAAADRLVNWRLHAASSGGLLLEQGSHVFDLANWFLDATPESVAGFGSIRQWRDWRDVDDTVQVLLRYPEGIQLTFEATLASSYGGDREQLAGTAGTMLLLRQSKGLLFKESDSVTAGWEAFARQELLDDRRGIVLDPEATQYVSDEAPGGPDADKPDYHAELAAFVDSVRNGTAPRCGAREGFEAAATALIALEAVRSGQSLDYPAELFEGP